MVVYVAAYPMMHVYGCFLVNIVRFRLILKCAVFPKDWGTMSLAARCLFIARHKATFHPGCLSEEQFSYHFNEPVA